MIRTPLVSVLNTCILLFLWIFSVNDLSAQCCAVGGGNPMASDLSQSVLPKGTLEVGVAGQFIHTTRFLNYREPDTSYLDSYTSQYLYPRVSYGVTPDLTISVEAGYFLRKEQTGSHPTDNITSKGIGDLIVMPRLQLFNRNHTEITAGIGIKVPLGSYNDSLGYIEPFSGNEYFMPKPPAMQGSTGSNDFVFNIFGMRRFDGGSWRVFSNFTYILRGWNPLGERFGDVATFSLFGGRAVGERMMVLVHAKYEWIGEMSLNPDIMMFTFPNYDPEATGSKKLFCMPQVNYRLGEGLHAFVFAEIPLWQHVNKIQMASQIMATAGISYRFPLAKPSERLRGLDSLNSLGSLGVARCQR